MTAREIIVNAVRRIESIFPGYFPEAKHNHYSDFGYPLALSFTHYHAMYERNGFAASAIEQTALKTWEDNPDIWESAKPKESQLEADIRQRFDDLRIWQSFTEADRRMMVGGYSGLIMRLADGKRFQEPVDTVPGGLLGLVEVIPAWSGQLTVAEWDTDEASENYGRPKMFAFNEASVSNDQLKTRVFNVHPDRVIIASRDGSVHCRSDLKPGYNNLLDMEKIAGAGGEGFYKNARSNPVLQIDKDAKIEAMAAAMGVAPDGIVEAMNTQVEDYQRGFDKLLMLQGIEAKTLGITLPSPEHFFNIALQGFAASFLMPLKILVGNQTGERASTEDQRSWNKTCMSRRENIIRPTIREFIRRLEHFGILKKQDWVISWSDLTEATQTEKYDRAVKMAEVNAKTPMDPTFTVDEIRGAVGYEPVESIGDDYE